MIAQVVFDLPLDGPFDYLIPEQLTSKVTVGMRVKVSFGPRPQIGYVVGVIKISAVAKLKPILSLLDASAMFHELDLNFAKEFSAYYGCSLGETLATMLRNKKDQKASIRRDHDPQFYLYRCQPNGYACKIQEIIREYRGQDLHQSERREEVRFLILVPDAFRAHALSQQFKADGPVRIGMRSSVFECDSRFDCVIMVDEEDSSYKQEQTPMYETRHVLLMRAKMYGFDIAFVGIAPSVELMAMVAEDQVKFVDKLGVKSISAKIVDLTNYKFVPGLISPPVRDALDAALKAGKKSILVLNRRGSYRLTRCVECAEILKCNQCDSSLIYSKAEGKFLCRHCTYTAPGDIVCPKCHKPSWRSVGIGVEQVQTELKKLFPQVKIVAFERATKLNQPIANFDILISTNAVLRFQENLKVQVAAFIDFDAELNRLDMRSAFNAFSLALHVSSMAVESILIQTRNINHYVLQNLSRGNIQGFYDEELKLRKEFGFSPFKHWVKMSWRGKLEKLTHQAAQEAYNVLSHTAPVDYQITPPLADVVGRKRDQFRYNVMAQANDVPSLVALIRAVMKKIKRPSRVIVTLNVDP